MLWQLKTKIGDLESRGNLNSRITKNLTFSGSYNLEIGHIQFSKESKHMNFLSKTSRFLLSATISVDKLYIYYIYILYIYMTYI